MSENEGAPEYGTTWFEEGQAASLRRVLPRQLEARFGPLSESLRRHLEECDLERLEELSIKFANATSLKDMGLAD